jgi:hypothetical protein
MILGAVWFSKDKPTMTTYLKPLMTSINELSYEGKYVLYIYRLNFTRSENTYINEYLLHPSIGIA